jgi:hypothetical protein
LMGEQLYIAFHTAGQSGNVAVRGQIRAVPEPGSLAILAVSGVLISLRRRRRDA